MPALTVMVALVASLGGQVKFERVDVISEDPGLWLTNEAPRLFVDPLTPTVRFLFQVKPVFSTPVKGLSFGVSLTSQSLVYEYPILEAARVSVSVGLQTRLLLPRGVMAGLAWRIGPVRLGAGISVISEASWDYINYSTWTVLPTLGVGFGAMPP